MKNATKQTRAALWVSAVSLGLCAAMLLGVTLAWFSDVASNKGNKIEAGTLKLEVIGYEADGTTELGNFSAAGWHLIEETDGTWQPGMLNFKRIKITNDGTLPLAFTVRFVPTTGSNLTEAMAYYLVDADSYAQWQAQGLFPTEKGPWMYGDTIQGVTDIPASYWFEEMKPMAAVEADEGVSDVVLQAGESKWIGLGYSMYPSAGNTYQNASFGMDIIVTATQTTAGAKVLHVSNEAELAAALASSEVAPTIVLVKDINVAGAVTLTKTTNIELNGYTLTADNVVVSVDKKETVDIANGTIVLRNGLGVQRAAPDQLIALNVTNVLFQIEGITTPAEFEQHVKNIAGTLYVPAAVQLFGATQPLYVNKIESNLYYDLNNCDTIIISEGITEICDHDFVRLGKVTEVVMPRTLTAIGGEFLRDSQKLEHVVFPQAVTRIGGNCLMNAMGLQTVTFQSATPPALAAGFLASAHNISVGTAANPVKIYVPKGAKAAYQTAVDAAVGTQPNTFYSIIEQ